MIFKDTNKIAYKKADKRDKTHKEKNQINCKEQSKLKVKSFIFDDMNTLIIQEEKYLLKLRDHLVQFIQNIKI